MVKLSAETIVALGLLWACSGLALPGARYLPGLPSTVNFSQLNFLKKPVHLTGRYCLYGSECLAASMATISEGKDLICEMCRMFYNQGWVTGTGGGISIKVGDTIVMAPSGVQKERMQPEDMFLLDAKTGGIKETPRVKPAPHKPPKLSECAPLFQAVCCHQGLEFLSNVLPVCFLPGRPLAE